MIKMSKSAFIKELKNNQGRQFAFEFSSMATIDKVGVYELDWREMQSLLYITGRGTDADDTFGLYTFTLKSLEVNWFDLDIRDFPDDSEFRVFGITNITSLVETLSSCVPDYEKYYGIANKISVLKNVSPHRPSPVLWKRHEYAKEALEKSFHKDEYHVQKYALVPIYIEK